MIKIRELTVSDSEELAAFFSTQCGQSEASLHDRLKWLGRNPASKRDIPFGVAAYNARGVCGAMVYVPAQFSDGTNIRTCVLSVLFYVDASARGCGLSLFMAFRSLSDRYPLYAATANSISAQLWSKFGGCPVAGSDLEYVRVCRSFPVVAELVLRMFPRKSADTTSTAKIPARAESQSDRLFPVDDPEERLSIVAKPSVGAYAMMLDPAIIQWRIYEAGERLYRYRTPESECLCALRCSRRGSLLQISALEGVDLWGTLDPKDYSDFISCIQTRFCPDIITFKGCSALARLPKMAQRFKPRRFPCSSVWLMDPSGLLENRFEFSPLAGE